MATYPEYIKAALRRAHYEQMEDGEWFASIPGFDGLWVSGPSIEEAREHLIETLDEWIPCMRGSARTGCPTWREWQAGYVDGVRLMPKHRVALPAGACGKERSVRMPLTLGSLAARALTKRLTDLFAVARDAARVRRLRLGHGAD
jgi:predicted RNase H-like HicB family nuclease